MRGLLVCALGICAAGFSPCTETETIVEPWDERPQGAVVVRTEAGTFYGQEIEISVGEGLTYALVGISTFDSDWSAIFQIQEHHLLAREFVVELGMRTTDAFGNAGFIPGPDTYPEGLSEGKATVRLGQGGAIIELEGDKDATRGWVEGKTLVSCTVRESESPSANEGMRRVDDGFETDFCYQFIDLLPADDPRRESANR